MPSTNSKLNMEKDAKKFIGHAWLDEHHDVYFMVELNVAGIKEKKSRFNTIMEKEKDISEIVSLASDPIEISIFSAEKALGVLGDMWETGLLVEYEGEDLEELEDGNVSKHYLRHGRIKYTDSGNYVQYICYPKHWTDVRACAELILD